MAQPPRSGSLEQVLRCLELLAQHSAFSVEMGAIISYMGQQAFTPAQLVDANGARFSLSLIDATFGDPASWMPTAFKTVLVSEQLRVVGPFPSLQILGAPGHATAGSAGNFEFDTGQAASWTYLVDVVVSAQSDRPEIAQRSALAMSQGMERLIRRNDSLGGLVELITAEGPPAPGGEVQSARDALLAGVMQRYRVSSLSQLL